MPGAAHRYAAHQDCCKEGQEWRLKDRYSPVE
jgi:hypothetical protein